MNDVDLKWWWNAALSAYGLIVGWAIWLRKPGEEAGAAVIKLREDLMEKLREMQAQMTGEVAELRSVQDKLEERVEHTPRRDELKEVAGDVKESKAKIDGLINTQSGQTRTLERIETYLLNHRGPQ